MYNIEFAKSVFKDWVQIHSEIAVHIKIKVHENLVSDPKGFEGKPLKGKKHQGLWRYRIGDYRILYEILDDDVIFVKAIKHRSKLY